jgi:hypothetical protein
VKAADLIDKIRAHDVTIGASEAELRKLKAEREKFAQRLLKLFAKTKTDTQRCGKLIAEKKFSAFPSIKDRPKFLRYVIKEAAYDLFQNRISSTALKEWEANGEKVPGVEVFKKFYISVKVKK